MSSILTADVEPFRGGFWHRQFTHDSTTHQIVFDVMFGILMPLACFYLDPGIIQSGMFDRDLRMISHAPLVYSISAIAMFTLMIWLAFATRIKAAGAIFAGVFVSGAVCSFTIGIIILPITFLGLFIIIGVLGFVPFFTGFVYLRNAIRAIGSANPFIGRSAVAAATSVGLLFAAGLPAAGEFAISSIVKRSMNQILAHEDPASFEVAVQRIKRVRWAVDRNLLVRAYEAEPNQERKSRLARAYKEITGEEIEYRLRVLND
jgi:hypothetical protein